MMLEEDDDYYSMAAAGDDDDDDDYQVDMVDHCHANDQDDGDGDGDDDDDLTVIVLEQGAENAFINQAAAAGWVGQDSPEMEERRRNVLLRELQIVQRASFIHFVILCLIPVSLLLVVIATVLGEEEECESLATTCAREVRTFTNAFTTRCICDAIVVETELP